MKDDKKHFFFHIPISGAEKNLERGPFRKKLDQLRARGYTLTFEDLRLRTR